MRRVRLPVLQANFIDFVGVDGATQHACDAELVGTNDTKLRAVKRAAQLDEG
jgi:hypothetical protein